MAPDDAEAERLLSELSNELMSPYCPGRTIAACPSEQARKLEDQILVQAKAGKSREEIEQSLVASFGPKIIGYAPQPVVLYGSAAAGVSGLLVLAWLGRRWRRRSRGAPGAAVGAAASQPAAAATPRKVSARDRDRIDDALDELDEF
jgi:cytochrome c-type biogenesis protein CcmH/NrfF